MTDPSQDFFKNAKYVNICNSSLIIGSNCRDIVIRNTSALTENEIHLLQIFNRLDVTHKIDFLSKAIQYESQFSNSEHAIVKPNFVFTVL